MKVIVLLSLFLFALSNRAVNKKVTAQLKKVAPFEVYEPEENKFRDWTDEELEQVFAAKKPSRHSFHLRKKTANKITPKSRNPQPHWDFRQAHPECMHPVRDQVKCAAGILFAATTALEQTMCFKSNSTVNMLLSVQQMLSCDDKLLKCTKQPTWEDTAYFFGNIGLVEESCFPFTSQDATVEECISECKDGQEWKVHKVLAWNLPEQPSDIKYLLPDYGPFWNEFDLYEDFLNYKAGIYQHVSGEQIGKHGANIIGYGFEDGMEFWICQNSFGEGWGESGYFRIKFDECRLDRGAVNPTPIFDY